MRYRKKPVVIDAIQWTGINVQEVLHWLGDLSAKWKWDAELSQDGALFTGATQKVNFDLTAKPCIKLTIKTLNGDMHVEHGEFIICGVQGEIYPCKADIMDATYDKVHPEYIEPEGPAITFQSCRGCGHSFEDCECNWNFDHDKAKRLIMEARAREYSKHELELADLLEQAKGFDAERRAYYDNFALVQADRHKKITEIKELKVLIGEALAVIDDCPEHPDKNQHTNFIEDLREQVKKF